MELFEGDYAIFVDADDFFVETFTVSQCLAKAVLENADICAIPWSMYYVQTKLYGPIFWKPWRGSILDSLLKLD